MRGPVGKLVPGALEAEALERAPGRLQLSRRHEQVGVAIAARTEQAREGRAFEQQEWNPVRVQGAACLRGGGVGGQSPRRAETTGRRRLFRDPHLHRRQYRASASVRPRIAIAVAFAAALLAAGCSSGKNVYAANPQLRRPALSVAAFIQLGEAICKRGATRASALQLPTNDAGLAVYLQRLEALATQQVRALEALRPPAGRRAEYAAFVRAARRNLEVVRGPLAAALLSRDGAELLRVAGKIRVLQRQTNRLAANAGLVACKR